MSLSLFDDRGKETKITFERIDNVVAIKRELCRLIKVNEINVELFCGNERIDNNNYLPEGVGPLVYRMSINESNDIIIKVAKNQFQIPELIQISKHATVGGELKSILGRISHLDRQFVIFDDQANELLYHATVDENHLVHDSIIKICRETDYHLSLSVTNLIPIGESFNIECVITDPITSLKSQVRSKRHLPENTELALFSEREHLENEDRLIDYSIANGNLIFYVDLDCKNQIKIGGPISDQKSGHFAKIIFGENLTTNSRIILKKYTFKGQKNDNFKLLTYDIITLLRLKNYDCQRFVKLECMFESGPHFYIGMEYVEGGSLDSHLPVTEEKVIHYSIQILEALIYLHNDRILYRNMKCSSILLDKNDNVKLGNFHLSKYMLDCNMTQLLDGVTGSKPPESNWAAPEMLRGQPYGVKADIWSYGATLIEMITGTKPYAEHANAKAAYLISSKNAINYVKPPNLSTDLDYIIDLCLRPLPEERPTAAELKDKFEEIENHRRFN